MKMRSVYIIQFLIVLNLPLTCVAGLRWVDIGVNGMTCSMCTRSVEMSVNRLDFVDSVVMDLEHTEGRVYLNADGAFDLNKIAKAVTDAGFSVSFVQLEFDLKDVNVNSDGSFVYQGQLFLWLDFKEDAAKSIVSLKLIDAAFLPVKESAQWKKKIRSSNNISSGKTFHVVQA